MDFMDAEIVRDLLSELVAKHWGALDGAAVGVRCEPVRIWQMSGVERLGHGTGPDAETVIFKYARRPFTGEARVLAHVADHGVPVPQLLAVADRPDILGMLLEDLGPSHRDSTLAEAAAAAVTTHATDPPPDLDVLDAAALAQLPEESLAALAELTATGRWSDTDDVIEGIRTLQRAAAERAEGAELPPFGLCHSEFHPTSLHIGTDDHWRLLDWARAFIGPGLLDLISWQGTTTAPDTAALRKLLDAYVVTGGPSETLADRGGLPVEQWSILWHRVWIIRWYLHQAITWVDDPKAHAAYQRVIRRHLGEAIECLSTPTT